MTTGERGMRRGTAALVVATIGAALVPSTLASAQDGTGTITGTVTAVDGGAAIGDVCVEALSYAGERAPVATRTTADGTFSLTAPEGQYLVTYNACEEPRDGYVGTIRGFDGEEDAIVEVTAGATTRGIDAALATAGTITGTVTREGSDEPLAGVCVQSQTDAIVVPAGAETATDGTYRITTAAPGDHQVVFIDCDAPRLHTPEIYPDTPVWPLVDEEQGELVTVAADGTTSGIDASLVLGGTIEGSVVLAHTGTSPLFALIGAWADDDRDEYPTAIAFGGFPGLGVGSGVAPRPGDPGSFDLPGLPADSYALELYPGTLGFGEVGWRQRWYQRAEDRTDARAIALAAGEVVDGVVLELVPSPSIEALCEGTTSEYPDVPDSNVHAQAIGCMSGADVVRGGADGRYRPTEAVRRDQMASFIARLLRTYAPTSLPSDPPDAFPDDDGNPHELSIDLLAAAGIVEGDGGRYRPSEPVGRGQMATYLARAYEAATGLTLLAPPTSFDDVEGTAHATSVRKVAVAAIAAGTSPSTYEPNSRVRRDQMGTFLARLYTRLFLDAGVSFGSDTGSGSATLTPAATWRP